MLVIKSAEVVLEDGTKLGFVVGTCTAKWRDFKEVPEGSGRTGKYFEVADESIIKDTSGNPVVTSYGMELQGSSAEIAAAKAAGKDTTKIPFSAVFSFTPVAALKTVVTENGKNYAHIMPIPAKAATSKEPDALVKLADEEISYWTKYESSKIAKKTKPVEAAKPAPTADVKTQK